MNMQDVLELFSDKKVPISLLESIQGLLRGRGWKRYRTVNSAADHFSKQLAENLLERPSIFKRR